MALATAAAVPDPLVLLAQPARNFMANFGATAARDSEPVSAWKHVAPKGRTMKLNSLATAAAAVAIVSGLGLTHHGAPPALHTAHSHRPAAIVTQAAPVTDASVIWLQSAGGQAQVTFNNDVSILAGSLEVEAHAPTVANHLAFDADARVVRAEAEHILATPALLPAVHRAEYQTMLTDFITVASLLQPGPGYGTTPQDYTAWYTALHASDITVA